MPGGLSPFYKEAKQREFGLVNPAPEPQFSMPMQPLETEPESELEPVADPLADRRAFYEAQRQRYEDRMRQAQMDRDANRITPEDRRATAETENLGALLTGLNSAAAKMANIGGKVQESDYGQTANQFSQAARDEMAGRQQAYNVASNDADDAMKGLQGVRAAQADLDLDDPSHPQAQARREILSQMLGRPIPEGMSIRQMEQASPLLMKRIESEERFKQRDQELLSKQQEKQSDRDLKLQLAAMSQAGAREARAARQEKVTADQSKAGGFARRLEQAEQAMGELEAKGYDRASYAASVGAKAPGFIKTEESKRQEQAERNFINAVLRRESGAAISPTEFESAEMQYFPRAGDSAAVKEQKRQNRLQVLESMKSEGGLGYERIPSVGPKSKAVAPKVYTGGSIPEAD